MTPLKIAFSYPDPQAQAINKEFHVYQVDPVTHARLSTTPLLVIPESAIPTDAAPATIELSGYGKLSIEAVPFDGTQEGTSAYLNVYVSLPPVEVMHIVP